MTASLEVGDRAPDFELQGNDGATHKLSDYRGQSVVLAFYPLDFSPGCTMEHAGLCDAMESLGRVSAQVLGISIDSTWTHQAFAAAKGIEYPLLADFHPKGAVGRMYGLYQPELGFHARWTIVVDPDGRVAHIQKCETGEVPDIEEIVAAARDAAE